MTTTKLDEIAEKALGEIAIGCFIMPAGCHPDISPNDAARKAIKQACLEYAAEKDMEYAERLENVVKEYGAKLAAETKRADELQDKVNELLDEIIDSADGTPDATGVGAYCTGLIKSWNHLMLGDRLTLRQERDALRKDKELLSISLRKIALGFGWQGKEAQNALGICVDGKTAEEIKQAIDEARGGGK